MFLVLCRAKNNSLYVNENAWQVMHLQKLNENNTCIKFGSMYEAIQQEPKLKELLHSVQADSDGATASS